MSMVPSTSTAGINPSITFAFGAVDSKIFAPLNIFLLLLVCTKINEQKLQNFGFWFHTAEDKKITVRRHKPRREVTGYIDDNKTRIQRSKTRSLSTVS